MYLSRIYLNDKKRETMRALSSPHILHGMVESSFDGKRERNLWRVDYLNSHCCLIILSEQVPNLSHIVSQIGYPLLEPIWETKDYNQFLERLEAGQNWRFRLRANPVRSSAKKGERGRIHAHVTLDQQKQWLKVRSESLGFKLDENLFDVVDTNWIDFKKGITQTARNKVTIRTAAFEGILKVTDPEIFKETLVKGIGRAKAYGCGLLTLARL